MRFRRRLQDKRDSSNANAHLVGYLLDREPRPSQPDHFIAIEDAAWAANCIPSLRAVCLGGLHASADTFAN